MDVNGLIAHCQGKPGAWLARYPDDASVMAYIGRQGWNNLALSGAIPDDELVEAIDESYRLVVSKLPEKHRPEGWDSLPSDQ